MWTTLTQVYLGCLVTYDYGLELSRMSCLLAVRQNQGRPPALYLQPVAEVPVELARETDRYGGRQRRGVGEGPRRLAVCGSTRKVTPCAYIVRVLSPQCPQTFDLDTGPTRHMAVHGRQATIPPKCTHRPSTGSQSQTFPFFARVVTLTTRLG